MYSTLFCIEFTSFLVFNSSHFLFSIYSTVCLHFTPPFVSNSLHILSSIHFIFCLQCTPLSALNSLKSLSPFHVLVTFFFVLSLSSLIRPFSLKMFATNISRTGRGHESSSDATKPSLKPARKRRRRRASSAKKHLPTFHRLEFES